MKKINRIIMIMIVFFAIIGTAFSAGGNGGLSVILASQNPDPVQPGNFVYLNVKISNPGVSSSNDVIVNLIGNNYFKIAPGDESSKNVGSIPSYSQNSNSNFIISKFKVFVKDNTPSGLNTVKFKVVSGALIYEYSFDVLVQNKNPNLVISSFNILPISAGSNQKLNMVIENPNSVSLKNVVLSLGLNKVTPTNILSILSGSNQKTIPVLKAGEKVNISFEIAASPLSSSSEYILPIDINYEDYLGNNFTKSILGSIKIYSKPILTLKLSSQDIFTTGNAKINLAIANPGISTIKGTQIEILKSGNYEVLNGGFEYIGNLNPDDFQTIQSNIYFKSDKDFNLKVKVNYLDSYNKVNEKIIEIPVKIYSNKELKMYGLAGAVNSTSTFSYLKMVTPLILIVISFFIGRRLGYNKARKLKK